MGVLLTLFGIVFISVYFVTYTINLLETVLFLWAFHRRAFHSHLLRFCARHGVAFSTAAFALDLLRRALISHCTTYES